MRHGHLEPHTTKSGPPRILIVEDNLLIAYLIDNMVSGMGYAVSGIAHTIALARQELAKRNFDAVLLDLEIGGQNSSEIANLLQETGIPFALVSGHDSVSDVRYKNVPLLHKPFTAYQLHVLLERLVDPARRTLRKMPLAS
ncbi:MAG: response regulator [Pseudolabrys sp.]|jgi:DNA-binding response OmpR family regulator